MELQSHDRPTAAVAAGAAAFLQEREAEHNLLLGLLGPWTRPGAPTEPPYLAVARRHGGVSAVAVRTAGRAVVLSLGWDDEASAQLAADLKMRFGRLPGVLGPDDVAGRFAAAWTRATGASSEVQVRERIYALDRVQAVARPDGSMAAAERDDRSLLYAWIEAFDRETTGDSDSARARAVVDARTPGTPTAGFFLWRTGSQARAVAGHSGITPGGIRVGPVYTPPGQRRRGYATALVADLSRLLLDRGHRRCFLFTDLGNPTSNAIYQAIGYRPVADATQHRFLDAPDGPQAEAEMGARPRRTSAVGAGRRQGPPAPEANGTPSSV